KQTKLKSGCSARLLHRIKLEGLRRQKSPSNVPSVAVLLPLAWVAPTGSNNDKIVAVHESACGTKRTSESTQAMSAFGGRADINGRRSDVRF
ncbi:MAG: hypothetical protein WAK67_02560, partial [Xanthobacteraceae bacterium]